jgi:AbrB family looped-hinge helix DNA binding protein
METAITSLKGQILVPRKLRAKYGLKPGTKVAFIEKDGELIIRALNKAFFESFAGILKGDGDLIDELMKEKKREREL